jgi:hypothetical protein
MDYQSCGTSVVDAGLGGENRLDKGYNAQRRGGIRVSKEFHESVENTCTENSTVNTWVDWIRSCLHSEAYPRLDHSNVHISDYIGRQDEHMYCRKIIDTRTRRELSPA